MPAFLAILPLLAGAPADAPRPTPVACAVMASGKCVYEAPAAGSGGNGGNASVNIIVVPQAGNGGNGGNATGGASAPAAAAAPRSAIASRCTMTIADQTVVEAVGCRYTASPSRFSVQAPSANGHHVYVATVDITPDRSGYGSLAGGATDAVRSFGHMRRDGPCWRSDDDSVSLCAWK